MARKQISEDYLKKLKDAVNIIDVVDQHVVLRKSGANYSGLCPFHSERSPSFSVSEQKQLYHCYGCKKGGDLVSFMMEIYGISFPEAVEELAERAKVPLPEDWDGEKGTDPEVQKRRAESRKKLSNAYKLNLMAAAFYRKQLAQTPSVQEYLRKRGVTELLSRNFYAGLAPASWDALATELAARKAPLPLAAELGLIRPSQKQNARPGPGYFDLFRNRAVFPIFDTRGKVLGFGGRTLDPEEKPKYINSSDSFIFHKSKVAFGLYQAQKHIREKDEVILVEGYFDVVALHAAGFENVVATCGTSLTPDHLVMFKRFASKVTILFDGDKAGVAATERAMEVGLEQGQVLYGASMPEGLDPDELLFDQQTGQPLPDGKERMQAILAAARPLLDARIDEMAAFAAQGAEAKTQAIKAVGGWLAKFKDPVGREVRLQAAQTKFGASRALFEKAGGMPVQAQPSQRQPGPQPLPQPRSQARPAPRAAAPRTQKFSQAERILLAGIAKGGAYSVQLAENRRNLPPQATLADFFDYVPAREFVQALAGEAGLLELLRANPAQLLARELDPQVRQVLTEALVEREGEGGFFTDEDFKLALNRGIARVWARFSQQIKQALAEAEAKQDAGLHEKLMKEYLDVQRKMKEFISFYDEA